MMAAGNEALVEEEAACYVEIGFSGRHVMSDLVLQSRLNLSLFKRTIRLRCDGEGC